MSARTMIYLLLLILYILIMVAFSRARSKYAGGKVGEMINLIMVTIVLLFLSDYVRVLDPFISESITYSLQALLRAAGLSFLAFGGIRMGSE